MENKSTKPIVYSQEQCEVFAAKDGIHIVVANAGSGKTEVSAEKISRLVKHEVTLKCGTRKPTPEELVGVLVQFLVVTFTKKAAAELDARIKKKLTAHGYPEPSSKGFPYRICMTLDSYLQRWLKHPACFAEWMKHDTARSSALTLLLNGLSPKAKSAIAEKKGNPLLGLFFKWDSLLVESRQAMLIDLLIRNELGQSPLPGITVADVQQRFESFKTNLDPAGPTGWTATYLDDLTRIFDANEAAMEKLALKERDPEAFGSIDKLEKVELENWQNLSLARAEFLSAHEIARARQYDPEKRRSKLAHTDVIRVIAPAKVMRSLRSIHSVANGYKRFKRYLCLMDFGDYLTNFMDTIRKSSFLLERKVEYPTMGIRRKYIAWDEYQDNSPLQFYLLDAMMEGLDVPHFALAVGDPFQSLYEFRGANPYQFIQKIEGMREANKSRLLSLTCSYRSAKSIVQFGNTIIKTLSRNGEMANPSRTAYEDEGIIEVAPPFPSNAEEADWVMDKIVTLSSTKGGTFMVVIRSSLAAHPIMRIVKESELKDSVQLMTVHSAKGLEADYVFVVGVMATKFPDIRCNSDQEANCFYVACTRPRRALFISSAIWEESTDSSGNPVAKDLGPSPYFSKLPIMKELALKAGWSEDQLKRGIKSHQAGLAAILGDLEKREGELNAEAVTHFEKTAEEPMVRSTIYLGAISPFENIPVVAEMPPAAGSAEATKPPTPEESKKLMDKCRGAFFKGKSSPDGILTGRESAIAISTGWVIRHKGKMIYTDEFKRLIRSAA